MYPYLRFAWQLARARRMAPLPVDGIHVSHHRCWPGDLDPWGELNNGRTLTLYDAGRLALTLRTGFNAVVRQQGWGVAVAGASVRYRRRVRLGARLEMRSACIGRDARFFYIHQALWLGDAAASAVLIRAAVTGADGIVPTDRVMAALGRPDWQPRLPAWVAAWIAAEGTRPWPPELEG